MGENRIVRGQRVWPKKLRWAKELRLAMTPSERSLWQALRTNRLEGLHFRRQQIIDGFIADFYCHKARLVVEVDGAIHARQVEYDEARDGHFITLGLKVLRLPAERVMQNLDSVLRTISLRCWRRIRSLPRASPLPFQGRGSGV